MNLTEEVCDSLWKYSLTLFVRNLLATGWLRWTRTRVKGGITSNPLFAYIGLQCYLQQSVLEMLAHLKLSQSLPYFLILNHTQFLNCSTSSKALGNGNVKWGFSKLVDFSSGLSCMFLYQQCYHNCVSLVSPSTTPCWRGSTGQLSRTTWQSRLSSLVRPIGRICTAIFQQHN